MKLFLLSLVAAGGLALTASPAQAQSRYYGSPYRYYAPRYVQPYARRGYSPGYANRYSYARPYYYGRYSGYPYSYGWPGRYPYGSAYGFGYRGPGFSIWFGR
jgi:hypothetical protein